jgi:hypothetical protein
LKASPLEAANIQKVLNEITDIPNCGCSRCDTDARREGVLALCDSDMNTTSAESPEMNQHTADMQDCLQMFRKVQAAKANFILRLYIPA